MKKRVIKTLAIIMGLLAIAVIAIVMVNKQSNETKPKEVKASSLVSTGDFRLNVDNKWDNTAKKNYADVKWDDVPDLSQNGYRMYQSEDGDNWHLRSTKYGKKVKVLNIYPDVYPNNVKDWMEGLNLKISDGTDHIEVTPIAISTFNASPASSLKDSGGNYKYDVIFVGTANTNNQRTLNKAAVDEVIDFLESGRGFLTGHDTMSGNPYGYGGVNVNFTEINRLKDYVGLGLVNQSAAKTSYPMSTKVKVVNNGYLMKYPFELENNVILTIPLTHSAGHASGSKYGAEIWCEFYQWSPAHGSGWSIAPNTPDNTTNFYLATKANGGVIQTGHSNGASTVDERKIIANTLINLSQITMDTDAQDHTVKDDKAPESPETSIRCGTDGKLSVKVDANDIGKEYQWYIEADTISSGKKESDIVKEEIKSNTAGYFYEVSDSPTSNLDDQVKALKDAYGKIDPADYDIYVAPDTDAVNYETAGAFTINEKTDSTKYVHTVAVDRANNVSMVSSKQIKDLSQPVDFEVERTADEAKLVELALDSSISPKMKSVEIQIPKNTEIKDFSSLTLPTDWYSFENSETTDYYSFTFSMETNNSIATIKTFLEELRFTIKSPVNDSGNIKVIFHEKVYTSWIDGNGVTHYYTYIGPDSSDSDITWQQSYNAAKRHKYKGLTGYLTTITSAEEHDFLYNNISSETGWLGGTRLRIKNSLNRINDESSISENINDYTSIITEANDWYWTDGPESGLIFFSKPTYDSPGQGAPPGVYQGFNNKGTPGNETTANSEPNNFSSKEFCLQFAQRNKYWNDLSYDMAGMKGYFVEFSEYGTQKEVEEITDLCWSAAIPQKISLKAYDETNGALTHGDLLYDQELRIGKAITVQPKDLEYYTFIEARELDDSVRGLSYTVSDTYQQGKLIYALRRANLHVRQVILDPMSELVVPSKGYITIRNQLDNGGSPALDPDYQGNVSVTSGKQADTPGFTDFGISASHLTSALDQVLLSVVVPEFYHYEGYYLTEEGSDPNGASHAANTSITTGEIALDRARIEDKEEFWITVYLKPVEDDQGEAKVPQPYSWDYKKNDLGKIKTKTP